MNILTPILKLLSDISRLRVILLLSKAELCVCELCGILEMPQPKISKILSKLRDLDLVTDQRQERFVFYSLNSQDALLNHIVGFIISDIEAHPQLALDQLRLANKEQYIDQCALDTLHEKP